MHVPFVFRKQYQLYCFIERPKVLEKNQKSHFADSFPSEATTVVLLPEDNCTGCSGITQVHVATHTKPARGWGPITLHTSAQLLNSKHGVSVFHWMKSGDMLSICFSQRENSSECLRASATKNMKLWRKPYQSGDFEALPSKVRDLSHNSAKIYGQNCKFKCQYGFQHWKR